MFHIFVTTNKASNNESIYFEIWECGIYCSSKKNILMIIHTKFIALNLDSWFVVSSNNSIVILLYCYINLRSSKIFWLFSGDICLSLSICSAFLTEFICDEVFEALLNLSAVLLPIKLPVASAVFWIALFESVVSPSVAWSRRFVTIFTA